MRRALGYVEQIEFIFNEVAADYTKKSELLRKQTLKEQKVLHDLEDVKLSASGCCKVIKKLQEIRSEKRELKNDLMDYDSLLKNKYKIQQTISNIKSNAKGKKYCPKGLTQAEIDDCSITKIN